MSRARDMANLGAQAGSGLDASDITTGTLGNTVQDNITRLGVVTTGTFNGTIGTSATHQNNHTIVDKFIKYKFTTNNVYPNTGSTETVASRANGHVTSVETQSVIGGYTYIYTFGVFYAIISANSQNSSVRYARIKLYDGDTAVGSVASIGNTSGFGTELADTYIGRDLHGASTAQAASYGFVTLIGASYYASNYDRRIYLTTTPAGTNQRITLYHDNDYPSFLKVEKIKGDITVTKSN